MIRYSPTQKSFYPYDIDYADLPADIIDVPLEDFQAVLAKDGSAKRVYKNGKVQAYERPSPEHFWNEEKEIWQLKAKTPAKPSPTKSTKTKAK